MGHNTKSSAEMHLGCPHKTIGNLLKFSSASISEEDPIFRLELTEFLLDAVFLFLVPEHFRRSKLKSAFRRQRGRILPQSDHNLSFLPTEKANLHMLSKRDIAYSTPTAATQNKLNSQNTLRQVGNQSEATIYDELLSGLPKQTAIQQPSGCKGKDRKRWKKSRPTKAMRPVTFSTDMTTLRNKPSTRRTMSSSPHNHISQTSGLLPAQSTGRRNRRSPPLNQSDQSPLPSQLSDKPGTSPPAQLTESVKQRASNRWRSTPNRFLHPRNDHNHISPTNEEKTQIRTELLTETGDFHYPKNSINWTTIFMCVDHIIITFVLCNLSLSWKVLVFCN